MQPLQADEPTTVGPYRLLGRLGHGGMGRVYLGRSAGGRTVAVKVVHPHFALDDQFRARFRREVEAARRVGGAWTAPVLDADPEAPVPWVATGYVAGPSLTQAVGGADGGESVDGARRALPEHSVRALGAGLAEALEAVHGLGLVHRDVKPSNVLLTLDGPRLIDFGIARATDGTASLTSTGVSIGSPGYMAPEQILGKGVTGAADVFSLGAVLVYAARGESPFPGDSSAALLYKVVHEEPELGALTGELRDVAAACLAKDPAARPAPREVARRLAPDGAARLVAAGWLPGPLVEQVSRGAVRLLDLEGDAPAGTSADAPADGVPPSGPVDFDGVGFNGVAFNDAAVTGPAPAGVFGPPDPSYGPVPGPRTETARPATSGRRGASGKPGRLSVSVSATTSSDADADADAGSGSADGRGRKVSCSVALAVAGALAAVTVGGAFLLDLLPGGGQDGTAAGKTPPHPSVSVSASGTAGAGTGGQVPRFYLGAWDGPAQQAGISFGTFRVELSQARTGERVGTVTSTDPLGIQCVDVLTLKSADAKELVAAGRADPKNGDTCAKAAHIVYLTRNGASLTYTSKDPQAGNPTADLKRVPK
ncbi:serine/threonine-protein kinase [Streptomyces beihaiensis]|uniref:Serine/threonine protein kinase n=1 Tax=Streptomyces beihaiensis TaxID=2984495 RepID=A0ABT3TW37_9ACTN|nr:serine/threonine-protein kinase [Streptomyces beihaiensis]MCX3061264.1 serine/threonine protein kinase [Streptomyces beihaiensis]